MSENTNTIYDKVNLIDTTDATSSTDGGAFTVAGGAAFGKQIYTGGNITTSGAVNIEGATSGAVSIIAQTNAGAYNFNLPTDAGYDGDVLISSGGGLVPMRWGAGGTGGGGGGGAGRAQAVAARYLSGAQSLADDTETTVLFDTVDPVNTVGASDITYTDGVFANTLSTKMSVIIQVQLNMSTSLISSEKYVNIKDSNGYTYGFTKNSVMVENGLWVSTTAIITLSVGGTFT